MDLQLQLLRLLLEGDNLLESVHVWPDTKWRRVSNTATRLGADARGLAFDAFEFSFGDIWHLEEEIAHVQASRRVLRGGHN